jgi:hypothetical protein
MQKHKEEIVTNNKDSKAVCVSMIANTKDQVISLIHHHLKDLNYQPNVVNLSTHSMVLLLLKHLRGLLIIQALLVSQ